MAKAVLNIGYFCENVQQAINAGLNGFAVTLLGESFGDQLERFPAGGIAFASRDHSHRTVYVTISAEPPLSTPLVTAEELAVMMTEAHGINLYDLEKEDQDVSRTEAAHILKSCVVIKQA